MSLPGDTLAPTHRPARIESPDDLGREARRIDYERGGAGIGDSSQGLRVATWRARLAGNDVLVSKAPYGTETLLFTETGITEISLAFDQNMQPMVAYVALGQAKLYWYDGTVPGYTTLFLGAGARSPFLSMDDKRDIAQILGYSDVLLFYILSNRLVHRRQRDRFDTEITLAWLEGSSASISKAGMNVGNRLQIEIVGLQNALAVGAVLGAWVDATYLASVTSIARAMPAKLVNGDLLYAVMMHRSAATPPAGWTLITSAACTAGATTQTMSLFKKNTALATDSGVSATFTQASSGVIGLMYFAVRATPGLTPSFVAATSSVVNNFATNTITAPSITAAGTELIVTLATSINAGAPVNQPSVSAGMGLFSGKASQTRLGAAYQRRNVGQTSAGRFTFDSGSPVTNGLAALTLRFTAA